MTRLPLSSKTKRESLFFLIFPSSKIAIQLPLGPLPPRLSVLLTYSSAKVLILSCSCFCCFYLTPRARVLAQGAIQRPLSALLTGGNIYYSTQASPASPQATRAPLALCPSLALSPSHPHHVGGGEKEQKSVHRMLGVLLLMLLLLCQVPPPSPTLLICLYVYL